MLLQAGLLGDGQVVILQPRRLAARLLAARGGDDRSSTEKSQSLLTSAPTNPFKPRVLTSEGRTFPVEIKYETDPTYNDKRPVWEQAGDAFSRYVNSGGQGDVLVFMPGGF